MDQCVVCGRSGGLRLVGAKGESYCLDALGTARDSVIYGGTFTVTHTCPNRTHHTTPHPRPHAHPAQHTHFAPFGAGRRNNADGGLGEQWVWRAEAGPGSTQWPRARR